MELIAFTNQELNCTIHYVLDMFGDPWFNAKNIGTILGYKKPNIPINRNVSDLDKKTLEEIVNEANRSTSALLYPEKTSIYINENGAVNLMIKTRTPIGHQLREWTCRVLLPSIRRNGAYALPTSKALTDSSTNTDASYNSDEDSLSVKLENNNIKIENVSSDDGTVWYKGKDVAKLLGYSCPSKPIKSHASTLDRKHLHEIKPSNDITSNESRSWYINETGFRDILNKSQTTEAIDVASRLDIRQDTKRKEIEIVANIQQFLTVLDVECIFQFWCGRYKIDLYIPDYRLAIEIDENDHNDRSPDYEENRENFLKKMLNCTFLRFDPDSKYFKLSSCIGEIAKHMKLFRNEAT